MRKISIFLLFILKGSIIFLYFYVYIDEMNGSLKKYQDNIG
jgi:hypothetical protein